MKQNSIPQTHLSICKLALAASLAFAAVCVPAQAQTLTTLYSFTGGPDGTQPNGLVRDSGGNLYGTARYAGDLDCSEKQGCGTAFKLNQTGTLTLLHTFVGGADGALPEGALVLDAAGDLFGTTVYGGNIYCGNSGGCGTVFKLNAAGKKTILYAFPSSLEASLPGGGVIEDANGNLYVTTYASNCIYRVSPNRQVELLCKDEENLLLCQPTNCAFGGPNFDQLYVSNLGRDHISVLDLKAKGQQLWTHRNPA